MPLCTAHGSTVGYVVRPYKAVSEPVWRLSGKKFSFVLLWEYNFSCAIETFQNDIEIVDVDCKVVKNLRCVILVRIV